jgi:hypothetical protein
VLSSIDIASGAIPKIRKTVITPHIASHTHLVVFIEIAFGFFETLATAEVA